MITINSICTNRVNKIDCAVGENMHKQLSGGSYGVVGGRVSSDARSEDTRTRVGGREPCDGEDGTGRGRAVGLQWQ